MTSGDHEQGREPIAIVGIGCRFPGGVDSPESFWDLLVGERDALIDIPEDRWQAEKFYDPDPAAGVSRVRRGGFLGRPVDRFDTGFFGISPREADHIDPQQRLLLEVAWEAVEDSGLTLERLGGSAAGVFVGGFTLDYSHLQFAGTDPARSAVSGHTATGVVMTMLANRISHAFDLLGPSMAVDTACSSSLVATHLACQSLRAGESSVALAGGVNLMLSPNFTIAASQGGFLSPTSRSRAFDASADGYVRGEGAGIVVLRRLSDALRDGDRIYAVIRGTAVTQDGRTNGITVPNGESQKLAMRNALADAGVSPDSVSYVEAHGTGTPVGDPIEANAIGEVYRSAADGQPPCLMASVKTNIGHLEAAAGVAGLIKTALCLSRRQVTAHLHLTEVNPAIDLDQLRLAIPVAARPLGQSGQPVRAAVNSFGFGGTNAHAVLESAPAATEAPAPAAAAGPGLPLIFPVTARSAGALAELAGRYADLLDRGADPAELAAAVTRRRTSHRQARLAIVSADPDELRAALRSAADDAPHPAVRQSEHPAGDPRLAFLFTGMGPQWWGMGRGLLTGNSVFQAEIKRCDAAFARLAGWSLAEAMLAKEASSEMTRTEVSQPANFALQVALAAVWRSLGINPDAIIGHSAGEVAAAYVAGALSFDDAVTVIFHRSRLQQLTSGQGRLVAVAITEAEARALDQVRDGRLAVAAVNSPEAVALVGPVAELAAAKAEFDRREVFCRFVDGDVPFHSPAMDAIEAELRDSLAGLTPRSPAIPLYSTATGAAVTGAAHDAAYWWLNVRAPVRFADAALAMIDDGYTAAIEVGPHPVLGHAFGQCLTARERRGFTVASLNRKEADTAVLARSCADLFLAGRQPDWSALHPAGPTSTASLAGLPLPSYPWQRERFWSETARSQNERLGQLDHSLLGIRQDGPEPAWRRKLDNSRPGYLTDHIVMGANVLPGACYVEMALAAGRAQFGADRASVTDIRFTAPVVLRPGAPAYQLETALDPRTGDVRIFGQGADADGWTQHASARLAPVPVRAPAADLAGARARCRTELDRDTSYAAFHAAGFDYGPTLRTLDRVWVGAGETLGRFTAGAGAGAGGTGLILDPVLLDGCFQLLLPLASELAGESAVLMPSGVGQVVVHARPEGELWAHARVVPSPGPGSREIAGDILLAGPDGQVLAEVRGFTVRVLDADRLAAPRLGTRWLHQVDWVAAELAAPGPEPAQETAADPDPAGDGSWLILGPRTELTEEVAAAFAARGHRVALAYPGDGFRATRPGRYEISPPTVDDLGLLVKTVLADGPVRGIVHLWSCAPPGLAGRDRLDAGGLDWAAADGPMSLLGLVRVLDMEGIACPLSVITVGAQPVDGRLETAAGLGSAPLWGLGRVLHHESLPLAARMMDLDPARALADVPALVTELLRTDTSEDQVAWRDGTRYLARLNPAASPPDGLPPSFRPDASYLVTGGLGALGLLTARWMAERGARRVILLSRTALPPRPQWPALPADDPLRATVDAVQDIEALGAVVETASVDVADPAALNQFLGQRRAAGQPPLRGVIHSAGTVRDQVLARVDRDHLDPVVTPKIRGGWALHEATADEPLDFFVLYSSVSSVVAAAGQGSYAAGNAFLDALAYYRRGLGLPALSINWGPWDSGMIAELGLQGLYARRGLDLISAETGLDILGQLVGSTRTEQVVASAHWPTVIASYPIVPRLIEHLGEDEEGGASADDLADVAQRLADAPPDEHPAIISDACAAIIGAVLRMPADDVPRGEPLNQIGLDSMIAVELRIRLEQALGEAPKLVFLLQDATVGTVAAHIHQARQHGLAEPADSLEELAGLLTELPPESAEALLRAAEGAVPSATAPKTIQPDTAATLHDGPRA